MVNSLTSERGNMIKNLLDRLKNFVANKEPVAVISLLTGGLVTFVTEAQGSLQGRDAWLAVGWAGATWLARHFATPVGKAAAAVESVDDVATKLTTVDDALTWLTETKATIAELEARWKSEA